MSVRISATDWVDDGVTGDDAVAIARAFAAAGADIIHVSTGQTSIDAKPVYGRMYQTPFSDQMRNEAGMPTIAVGNITDADQVNAIIAAGRADLCALARPHLIDPFWTLHAAAELGYTAQRWPLQYLTGKQSARAQPAQEGDHVMTGASAEIPSGPPRGRHRRRARHRRGDRPRAGRSGADLTLMGRTASAIEAAGRVAPADARRSRSGDRLRRQRGRQSSGARSPKRRPHSVPCRILINNAGQADAALVPGHLARARGTG